MELTERDIYRTPSMLLTSLLHRSCYTPACCTVLVTHLLVAPFLLHTCLLHRSCCTPACCTVLLHTCLLHRFVAHLLVAPFLLHTSLLHRSCYTPESRESGRLAVLGNVTQNGLLADTTCTCPIVVSHQADVHLQALVLRQNHFMDG